MNKNNNVIFQADGSPYSTTYQDIYFDTSSGSQQSKEVFIHGNRIKERLMSAKENFVVAETGFGTGLNFFLTVQLYDALTEKHTKPLVPLTFISVEKFPLTREQILTAMKYWPDLAHYANEFIQQYPEQPENNQQITITLLNKSITLLLICNDASVGLSALGLPPHPKYKNFQANLVDAWYLDGFSPDKNPEMWRAELFKEILRLSKSQATIATFTVAGFVKRHLVNIGFRVFKKATVGKKKESLQGVLQQHNANKKGYQIRPKIHKPQTVSIIGGGIASACTAYALAKEGIKVTLYCQDEKLAQGASSNHVGAVYPLLHQQQDDISLFFEKAFWHAKETYQHLYNCGFTFAHQWCGVLDLSFNKARQQHQAQVEQLNAWERALILGLDKQQASQVAGITLQHGGLFMPNAGWVSPPALVNALINAAKSTPYLTIKTGVKITAIEQLADKTWQLISDRENFKANVLIACGGAATNLLAPLNDLPLYPVRGQISNMKANNRFAEIKTVICHKGYLTPPHKEIQCIGATFEKNNTDTITNIAEDEYNLRMLSEALPEYNSWTLSDIKSSKARIRCMTPDHLPMVGAVPNIAEHQTAYSHLSKDKNWRYESAAPCIDNLYVLTGLGARGLCTAPLLADILAADLTGKPYPVDDELLFNIAPNRFIIRDLIKRKK